MSRKDTALAQAIRDPIAMLREMTSGLDRRFEEPSGLSFRWPSFRARASAGTPTWAPGIDVFETDNRLVTKIDLPGMKKEDVTVEVTDGHLAISGKRTRDVEEKTQDFYRSEREYGSFYRAVPLPEGAKLDDVKATFADGVLEVSIPLPARAEPKVRKVEIQESAKATKTAA